MNDPWQQGYEAYENGLYESSNPYTCDWYNEWQLGYWAAIDDEISYQEFLESEKANGEESTSKN